MIDISQEMSRKKPLNPQGDVILRNEAIQRVTNTKFLGVIVDQHLNWKDHISMVSHKISKSCGIISRIRNTLDIKSKKLIYYSLIHLYLTYSINVWSSTYRTNLKTLHWEKNVVLIDYPGWVQPLLSQLAYVISHFLCS